MAAVVLPEPGQMSLTVRHDPGNDDRAAELYRWMRRSRPRLVRPLVVRRDGRRPITIFHQPLSRIFSREEVILEGEIEGFSKIGLVKQHRVKWKK